MREELFQFIWQYRLYSATGNLFTTDGQLIQVAHPGYPNKNAGPDFLEARIRMGATLWAGHVELHLKSSDWKRHHHEEDPLYNKLILHVVFQHDETIATADGSVFPTLELGPHLNQELLLRYENLLNQTRFVPCAAHLEDITELQWVNLKSRMLSERLEQKIQEIRLTRYRVKGNWQELFYLELASGFGLHVNKDIFRQLAASIPLNILSRCKQSLFRIEALLFGQAGMLDSEFHERYPRLLQQEYAFLRIKYNLKSIPQEHWKFLRMRPANFPTVRIAQFAALIHQSSQLAGKILEAETLHQLESLFTIELSPYWLTHYTFQEASSEKNKAPGKAFIRLLILNVLIPYVYVYGKDNAREIYCTKAMHWLHHLPAESNHILSDWKKLGAPIEHAADSQALLHLKTTYCDHKACLHCSIGYQVMKGDKPERPDSEQQRGFTS